MRRVEVRYSKIRVVLGYFFWMLAVFFAGWALLYQQLHHEASLAGWIGVGVWALVLIGSLYAWLTDDMDFNQPCIELNQEGIQLAEHPKLIPWSKIENCELVEEFGRRRRFRCIRLTLTDERPVSIEPGDYDMGFETLYREICTRLR